MPKLVSTDSARALLADGVRFLDVLPPAAFAQDHIEGALNLPLAEVDDAPERFDSDEPVVVYCFDHQ